MKRILITVEDGRVYSVDANAVAHDIATHRSEGDPETTYGREFENAIKDNFELTDWLQNNMNWYEMTPVLESTPKPLELREMEVIGLGVQEEKRK